MSKQSLGLRSTVLRLMSTDLAPKKLTKDDTLVLLVADDNFSFDLDLELGHDVNIDMKLILCKNSIVFNLWSVASTLDREKWIRSHVSFCDLLTVPEIVIDFLCTYAT